MVTSDPRSGFSMTQAAADQMARLRGEYLSRSPDDPPVLAGLFAGRVLADEAMRSRQISVGFWLRSEVSGRAWAEENIVEIAGFQMLLELPQIDLVLFRNGVIDFSPEEGFVIRLAKPE